MSVYVIANGKQVEEWQNVTITDSMVDMCDSFRIGTPNTMLQDGNYLPIAPLDDVRIYHDKGSTPELVGYCEDVDVRITATENTVSPIGRSRACDLIDCSPILDGFNLKNVNALQIAQKLGDAYKIKFSLASGVDAGAVFDKFKVEVGETAFSAINRALQKRSLLPSTIPSTGDVELIKPAIKKSHDELIVGVNCKMASGKFSAKDRFSEYRVLGQNSATRGKKPTTIIGSVGTSGGVETIKGRAPKKTNQIAGTATDSEVNRTRLKIIRPGERMTTKEAEERALWEATYRFGKSSTANLATTFWHQSNGDRWESNMLVPVTIPQMNIYKFEMLIQVVSKGYGTKSGESCQISVVHPDTFTPAPTKDVAKKKKSVWNRATYISSVGTSNPGEIIDKRLR